MLVRSWDIFKVEEKLVKGINDRVKGPCLFLEWAVIPSRKTRITLLQEDILELETGLAQGPFSPMSSVWEDCPTWVVCVTHQVKAFPWPQACQSRKESYLASWR